MSAAHDRSGWAVWLIGPGFLAVAFWLLYASPKAEIPRGPVNLVPLDQTKAGPRRSPLKDAADAHVGGVTRACSECHKLFTPSPVETRTLVQHKDIVLNHGINARCFNCHHAVERDKLVLHDGTLIPFSDAPKLCSQCHGTLYHDWQRGAHGKTLGSWDASSGKQRRLACNECHDPHSPAYKPYAPLPGPDTLRMGDQTRTEEHEEGHQPLRRWSQPDPHAPAPEPAKAPNQDAPKEHQP